jgi:hypothetical protein
MPKINLNKLLIITKTPPRDILTNNLLLLY